MYEALTQRQRQILDYIYNYFNDKGYPPSVREICAATKLKSTATVHGHLVQLEKKGFLKRDPQKPRAIEIINAPVINRRLVDVPLVGKVTAGEPILAEENIQGIYPLPKDMVPSGNIFMLSVKGDSMINAGILDGDYVIVQETSTAQNGDIVVALIENEATVKRFYQESGHFLLQPENPAMEPIVTKELKILGKVVGLFRKI